MRCDTCAKKDICKLAVWKKDGGKRCPCWEEDKQDSGE